MDLFDLKGKTALVTGASSGLGRQMAKTLSIAGAKIIATGRNQTRLTEISTEIKKYGGEVITAAMDISENESVHAVLDKIIASGENIDILVNSAGIGTKTKIFSIEDDFLFDKILRTNVEGVWRVTRLVANHMKKKSIMGSIINIASVNGAARLEAGLASYAASKAAVIQMTKALVGELAPFGIRINAISPGLFHTPLTNFQLNTKEDKEKIAKMIPLGFVADPEDIAGTILYLASNKASRYVTGSCLTIDGGVSWGG